MTELFLVQEPEGECVNKLREGAMAPAVPAQDVDDMFSCWEWHVQVPAAVPSWRATSVTCDDAPASLRRACGEDVVAVEVEG